MEEAAQSVFIIANKFYLEVFGIVSTDLETYVDRVIKVYWLGISGIRIIRDLTAPCSDELKLLTIREVSTKCRIWIARTSQVC